MYVCNKQKSYIAKTYQDVARDQKYFALTSSDSRNHLRLNAKSM